MQLDTLTSLYYGEVSIRQAHVNAKGVCYRLWDMLNADGVDISSRYQSLMKRRLIRWVRWPSPDQQMVQAIVLTPAGVKEMEAIDA